MEAQSMVWLPPVSRNHVFLEKQNGNFLDEVVRHSGFCVPPGSHDRARTNPIRQGNAKGDIRNRLLSERRRAEGSLARGKGRDHLRAGEFENRAERTPWTQSYCEGLRAAG